ncbi:oligosaccharide flippase family protein [Blastococcus sp. HT6-30]|uniref:oligosaccharide flippase family protein n=1 Tax=Blastococcus sp. HT6-30 TaxID=3144843 RepID=UPI0032191AA4
MAIGALWIYGSQVGTILLQFGYAAITSRALDPAAFGAYSVALTVAALAGLLANGGLGQTVARVQSLTSATVEGLLTLALLVGLIGASALYLTSGFWSALWSAPDAELLLKVMAISAFISPCLGLTSGLVRRLGRFRQLSIGILASNLLGMALSLAVLAVHPSAIALTVSPVAAQLAQLATFLYLGRGVVRRPGNLRPVRTHLSFSGKIMLTFLLAYATGNLPRLAGSHALGTAFLGQLNRAEVLSSIPLQQLQNAIVQAVYPEFRHDEKSPVRAFRVWTDMLGVIAWLVGPIAGLGCVAIPALLPVIFGDGWELAATLTVPLVLLGAVQMPTVVLMSGIEAIGRFAWIWFTQALALVASCAGAVLAWQLHSWVPVVIAPLAATIVQHLVHVAVAISWGYVDGRRLLLFYVGGLLAGVAVGASAYACKYAAFADGATGWGRILGGLALLCPVIAAFLFRRQLPISKLLATYSILR